MKWTFEQLKTFKVVAELGTMTAAAEALGFTAGRRIPADGSPAGRRFRGAFSPGMGAGLP